MLPIAAPRYTHVAFPAYSFVPGRNPHPHTSPKGHRFQPERALGGPARLLPSVRWRDSTAYLLGCDLFNHAFWWEAHEAWEVLWRLSSRSSTQGRFFKTLIQVTAAHLILHMGNGTAANALLGRAQTNANRVCNAVPGTLYMGLNLREWMTALQHYYDHLPQGEARRPEHDPSAYPPLRLECA